MITDDEIQIRKGLRMKINWEEEGFEIAAEASNGKEALEKLEKNHIDIVITDMRMPIMDGIEFAKRCHENFPNVKVVVLSGYSDFEYVKNSMKEGVKDYLLKPVAPDELTEVLRKLRIEVNEEKSKRAELSVINQRALTHLQEEQEQYLLFLVKDEFFRIEDVKERLRQLKLIELSDDDVKGRFLTVEIRNGKQLKKNQNECWISFQMLSKEIAKQFPTIHQFYNPNYKNMIHFLSVQSNPLMDDTTKFINSLQELIKKELELETVVGVGSIVQGVKEFKKGYISSLLSWSQSQLGVQSQILYGFDGPEKMFEFSPDFERKLTNSIENANFHLFKQTLIQELKIIETHSILSFSIVANHVLFLLGSTIRKYDLENEDTNWILWNCQQRIWELNSQQQVIDSLLDFAQIIVEKVRLTRFSNSKLIESIRHYIDLHYANEISLSTLSELFHINSAHLSETFKNHVGENFSDYLVKLRMNKAEKLLKDEQLKIIDVANLVGFSSSGYFSTVFKKHTSQTPVEYRRSIQTTSTDF